MTANPNFKPKKTCPAEKALQMISGRWKILILWELLEGVKRFGELHKALPGITQTEVPPYK